MLFLVQNQTVAEGEEGVGISDEESVTKSRKSSAAGQQTALLPTVTKKEDAHSDNEKANVNANTAN